MLYSQIIQSLCGEPLYIKIVAVLLKREDEVSGRGLTTLLSASTFKTHYALKYLVGLGVLLQTTQGKACLYRLNKEHILFKKVFSPLIQFQENVFAEFGKYLVSFLKPKPVSVIVYGSVARSEETLKSDLDLLLITKEGGGQQAQLGKSEVYEKIARRYGNMMTLNEMSESTFVQRFTDKEPLVTRIVREGRVIFGKSIADMLTNS